MFSLVKRNVVMQTQQWARSLNCTSNCLRVKFSVVPGHMLAEIAESMTKWRKNSVPTPNLSDRFPKALVQKPQLQEPRKMPNLLNQPPRPVNTVQDRYQELLAAQRQRQQNYRLIVTKDSLHMGRWFRFK